MPKTLVTPEIEKFIFNNYLKISQREIANHFGFSREVCKNFYSKNKLLVPLDVVEKFRTKALSKRTTFTDEEDQFIKENYLTMPVKTIGRHLNRSGCGISGRLKKLNLDIPVHLIEKRKKDSVFKPGIIPFNKGKKITDFMSPEAIEHSKMHRFKKGNIPRNALPVGTEVLRENKKSGRFYTMIKVPGEKKLKFKHVHVWETYHNKKVLPDQNIIFIDGNTQNFDPKNLTSLNREELMKRNTIHKYPESMREIMYLKGRITREINKHLKSKK